jgi:hypothetical protein
MATLGDIKRALRAEAEAEIGGAKGDGVVTCWVCGGPPAFYSAAGRREFGITGMCEFCFDDGCMDPEDKCGTCEKPDSWHAHGRPGACATFLRKEGA